MFFVEQGNTSIYLRTREQVPPSPCEDLSYAVRPEIWTQLRCLIQHQGLHYLLAGILATEEALKLSELELHPATPHNNA